MRLLLTLLALLTGLATADRAVAAPATPVAMGALVMLAETGQAEASDSERGPVATAPARRASSVSGRKARQAALPHRPGLLIGSDCALE